MNHTRRREVQDTWMALREEYTEETTGWRLVFDSRPKRRLGQCRYGPKEIAISSFHVDGTSPLESVLNTLRHEVAHILAGSKAKHGPIWRSWARKVGADPSRCGSIDAEHMPAKKWELVCRNCNKVLAKRHRRSNMSNRYHTPCGPNSILFYRQSGHNPMNIFYLHDDPIESARMHCDKHVVKMVIEYAQLLSTSHRILDGTSYQGKTKLGRNIKRWRLSDPIKENVIYKASHIKHPCAMWVRDNAIQYKFMYDMFIALCDEYTHRYNRVHLTDTKLRSVISEIPTEIEKGKWSLPPQCMPDDVKRESVIEAYHKYYAVYKKDFAKWTRRAVPRFMDV